MSDGMSDMAKGIREDGQIEEFLRLLAKHLAAPNPKSRAAAIAAGTAMPESWRARYDGVRRDKWAKHVKTEITKLEAGDKKTWAELLGFALSETPAGYRQLKPHSPFKKTIMFFIKYDGGELGTLITGDVHLLLPAGTASEEVCGGVTYRSSPHLIALRRPTESNDVEVIKIPRHRN